jgi:alkanesulfonate monooxygenase SsuD/methylene tetrahydromethanopterin reductase-like flavin-dependent oxidoreductase (luciferase family)
MDFGVTFQTDPPAWRVVELTKRAERLGFTHAWTFDSHKMLSATERRKGIRCRLIPLWLVRCTLST